MIKILLIEDNQFIIDIYIRSFDAWNKIHDQDLYQVIAAYNGDEGLKKAFNEKYDFILLDILLPNKSGINILKELKANSKTKDIPICMLTNLGDDQVMEQAYKLGAIGYMVKSNFTPEQIVEQTRNLLNQANK